MKKRNIIIMCTLLIVILLLVVGYFLVGNYFYNIALNPHTSKSFVLGDEKEATEEEKKLESWLKENSKDVYITSNNNGKLKLHAYEVLSKSNNENNTEKKEDVETKDKENQDIWAIVVHGYMSKGLDMAYAAKEFNNRGYNVLVLDLRGHGLSKGNYIGMGWHDRLDLLDWTNYVINNNKDCKIIWYGVSMGAATVMMATGENVPSNVKLAIEDCGYSSIWDEFKVQLKSLFNLPSFPVLNAASTISNIKAGYDLKEGSSIEQLKKSKTPTLFIHGSEDKFVPFYMLDEVYNAARCKKDKLVIEGAAHVESDRVNPDLYWSKIDEFIKENIND